MTNIIIVVLFAIICIESAVLAEKNKKLKKERALAEKHLAIAEMLDEWIDVRQHHNSLEFWFKERSYRRVAIYGMGLLGKRLTEELIETDIDVVYCIDQRADSITMDVNIVYSTDGMPEVDVIVVTTVSGFNLIKCMLQNKIDAQIIPLKYVLEEV